ncbi:hypothetical protein L218DRAFT_949794 [Marasmius fiardii PR-910]|nr:hypothetical protein L218DRAFT_949794 [Marasmius fiardii PR-910]
MAEESVLRVMPNYESRLEDFNRMLTGSLPPNSTDCIEIPIKHRVLDVRQRKEIQWRRKQARKVSCGFHVVKRSQPHGTLQITLIFFRMVEKNGRLQELGIQNSSIDTNTDFGSPAVTV